MLQDKTESVEVGAAVEFFAGQLFGGGVGLGVGRLLQYGKTIAVGQAKVDEFHIVAIPCDENIARLQIAVNDLLGMAVGERVQNLAAYCAPQFWRGILS